MCWCFQFGFARCAPLRSVPIYAFCYSILIFVLNTNETSCIKVYQIGPALLLWGETPSQKVRYIFYLSPPFSWCNLTRIIAFFLLSGLSSSSENEFSIWSLMHLCKPSGSHLSLRLIHVLNSQMTINWYIIIGLDNQENSVMFPFSNQLPVVVCLVMIIKVVKDSDPMVFAALSPASLTSRRAPQPSVLQVQFHER